MTQSGLPFPWESEAPPYSRANPLEDALSIIQLKTYLIFLPSSRLLSTAALSPSGNGIRSEPGSTAGFFKVLLIDGVKTGGIGATAFCSCLLGPSPTVAGGEDKPADESSLAFELNTGSSSGPCEKTAGASTLSVFFFFW